MSLAERVRSIPPKNLLIICALNLLPLCGVILWDWRSFDLIFLYWMENVVIGAVMILRMVARRYESPFELLFPLFLAPFLRSLSKPLPLLAASLAPLSSVADDELFTPTHASTSQIQ